MKHEPICTQSRHDAKTLALARVGLLLVPIFGFAIGVAVIFIIGRAGFALAGRALGY